MRATVTAAHLAIARGIVLRRSFEEPVQSWEYYKENDKWFNDEESEADEIAQVIADAEERGRVAGLRAAADLAKWHGHEPQASDAILALLPAEYSNGVKV
jgi:hypothetical protein